MTTAHFPRKRFGQHFLHDSNTIDRILQAIDPQPDDQMIEIGPGRGALTLPLLEHLRTLTVIEIDRDLVSWWQAQACPNLKILATDALKVNYCELVNNPAHKLRLVGNLPYNTSTPLLFHLMTFRACIHDMYFMLQKEVVERITAQPGSKIYGRLSVMLQYYCETRSLFSVRPHAFHPPPRVDSAVIWLHPYNKPPYQADASALGKIVNQAFSQRRKTLRNALKGLVSDAQMAALGIDPACRAETLPLEAFVKLSHCLPVSSE